MWMNNLEKITRIFFFSKFSKNKTNFDFSFFFVNVLENKQKFYKNNDSFELIVLNFIAIIKQFKGF